MGMSINDTTIITADQTVTGDALFANARRAATGFTALGVGPGDTVALLLHNDITFFEAAFGAALVGAYAVPVNTHAASAEAEHILTDSGAKIVVAHTDLAA